MPLRYLVCLFVFALTPGWARAAVNLLANPGLATDYTHWLLSGAPVGYEWSPVDETGKLNSGSLRLSGMLPDLISGFYSDCFPVTPGAALVFGGSFSATDGETGVARLRLVLYGSPGCGGAAPQRSVWDSLQAETSSSLDTWAPMQGHAVATVGEVSARLVVAFASHDAPPTAREATAGCGR